jgi:hypothetical protein
MEGRHTDEQVEGGGVKALQRAVELQRGPAFLAVHREMKVVVFVGSFITP